MGAANGRLMLFYPMVRGVNDGVFMEHRLINNSTGELRSVYAEIQKPRGPALVGDFSLQQ